MRRRCACLDNLRTGAANFVLLWACADYAATLTCQLRRGLRASLARLLLQAFAGNAHALLLVGIGRTQRAQICRDLPLLTLIRARNHHVRLLFDGDRYAFRY